MEGPPGLRPPTGSEFAALLLPLSDLIVVGVYAVIGYHLLPACFDVDLGEKDVMPIIALFSFLLCVWPLLLLNMMLCRVALMLACVCQLLSRETMAYLDKDMAKNKTKNKAQDAPSEAEGKQLWVSINSQLHFITVSANDNMVAFKNKIADIYERTPCGGHMRLCKCLVHVYSSLTPFVHPFLLVVTTQDNGNFDRAKRVSFCVLGIWGLGLGTFNLRHSKQLPRPTALFLCLF